MKKVICKNLPEPVIVETKLKCSRCGKEKEDIKLYVVADDIEHPVPYCEECYEQFKMELLIEMSKHDWGGENK